MLLTSFLSYIAFTGFPDAQIISDWFLSFHYTQMASTVTGSHSNRASLECGETGHLHHGRAVNKSCQYQHHVKK